MESKEAKEKVTCECGAVVIKNNLKAHLLTKKHMASTGQVPLLPRGKGKGVWQEPDVNDINEVDEEEGSFEDDVMDILELMNQKIDKVAKNVNDMTEVSKKGQLSEEKVKAMFGELATLIKSLNIVEAPKVARANEKCL